MVGGGIAAFMVRHADQMKVDLQGVAPISRANWFSVWIFWASGSAARSQRPDVLHGGA